MPRLKQPTRGRILEDISECFQQMYQWVVSQPDEYARYAAKAEALIEILEVVDCGSVGGFDNNNPSVIPAIGFGEARPKELETNFPLFDRYLMVLGKYGDAVLPTCGHSTEFFSKFFRDLHRSTW